MAKVMLFTGYWRTPWREYFTERHATYLGQDLCCIVTERNKASSIEYGCPTYALIDRPPALLERTFRKISYYLGNKHNYLQHRFKQILIYRRPDIVLFEYGTNGVKYGCVCAECDVPFAIHFHGYDVTLAFQDDEYRKKLIDICKLARLVIANSRSTKLRLCSLGLQADKIVVKYMGVAIPEKYCDLPVNDNLLIAHVANYFPVKGPLESIKAFEMAQHQGLNGKLIMAGDGPLFVECERYVREHQLIDIKMLGTVNNLDVLDIIRKSHILTQHSINIANTIEGFGISIAEAMSLGRAVIVTNHGSFPELVVDGDTGILVSEGDWVAQGKAFLCLQKNRSCLERMGKNGYERAKELFSEDAEQRELRRLLGLIG